MKETADKLFGKDYIFSVLTVGRHELNLGTVGVVMGGAVRVGLEDNLYLSKGKLAKSNADLVAKILRIVSLPRKASAVALRAMVDRRKYTGMGL